MTREISSHFGYKINIEVANYLILSISGQFSLFVIGEFSAVLTTSTKSHSTF